MNEIIHLVWPRIQFQTVPYLTGAIIKKEKSTNQYAPSFSDGHFAYSFFLGGDSIGIYAPAKHLSTFIDATQNKKTTTTTH